MTKKIRILFLSSNPWTTSRILVDEEMREIFEKLQEGPYRDNFELHRHTAIRAIDLQRLLMMHEPHIVHFSGHGSKKHKIILGGKPGRGKQVDRDGLAKMFALYRSHLRLVVLNACFTKTQAKSLSQVIDYSVGAGKGIGDKEGVAFAGAFYRALGFGKSVKDAFESAKAEVALTRMPRTKGIELFLRKGVEETDSFPVFQSNARNHSVKNFHGDARRRARVRSSTRSGTSTPPEIAQGVKSMENEYSRSNTLSVRHLKRERPNPSEPEGQLVHRLPRGFSLAEVTVKFTVVTASVMTPKNK